MIITVTLNPAIDKTIRLSCMNRGQVNRAEFVKNVAGGKGINVGKVLLQYHYPVTFLGFVGGYTGSFIEEAVGQIGGECRFTHVSGETRTSMNLLEDNGYVTEILEPGPVLSYVELLDFKEKLKEVVSVGDWVVFSGSAPAGIPKHVYAELIALVKELGAIPILDTSSDLLKEGIRAVPFMVKPNVAELQWLLGRTLNDLSEIRDAAYLLGENGMEHVMVSMGEKGMVYVHQQQSWYAKAPRVKVVNTVGSGDSAVAAFVMAREQNLSAEDTLRLCVAVSAANTTTLENAVIPEKTAEQFMEQIVVSKI